MGQAAIITSHGAQKLPFSEISLSKQSFTTLMALQLSVGTITRTIGSLPGGELIWWECSAQARVT